MYGFSPIETPAMENLSVLMGKYGDEGDQLLFKVLNSGDYLKKSQAEDYNKGSKHLLSKISEKGLRYDLTVPFARYVVMNQHNLSFPFKRYQIQPVWRADRPQRGRYREFYQCDADIIGSDSLWNEVELTLLIHDVFDELGLKDFELKINQREILFAMASAVQMKGKEISFCVSLDKLDKIGQSSVLEELDKEGADTNKVRDMLNIIDGNQSDIEKINQLEKITGSNKGYDQIREFIDQLSLTGRKLQISLDFSLARGLSYYTGMIYEVKPTRVKMGSICGGGRYDNLTGVFGLSGVSGIGISFGLDRIYDVLEELNLFPLESSENVNILVTHFDDESFKHSIGIVGQLRNNGISAELYPENAKIKKQFNYANKLNIPYVLTVGNEEIKSEKYTFKNMNSGNQELLSLDEIILKLKG